MAQSKSLDIQTVACAQNRAVVLEDDGLFYGTGYKMLRSQNLEYLAPCSQARLNGHIQLVYFTHNYVPLLQFARGATCEPVARVLRGFVDALLELRGNGFLSDRNVLLDVQSVFIDPETESVKLLYVPLTCPVAGSNDVEIGRCVFDACQAALSAVSADIVLADSAAYEWGKLEALRDELGRISGTGAGRGTQNRVGQTPAVPYHPAHSKRSPQRGGGAVYRLTARTGGGSTSVQVSGPRTVLGKSKARADCVVALSPAISRSHCVLRVKEDGTLVAADLGSSNGTWVDGTRLKPQIEHVVRDGSSLRLADITFTVKKVRG